VESSDNEDDAPPQLTLLPAAAESDVVSEMAKIQLPPTDQQLPVLTLQQPLKYSYDPATVQVYANVVQATHGQTVEEVLGSGDGHETNERFALKKPPLTYVPTATASGAKSTLEVRVNGVLWQEVPSLYPLTPQDQNYIIRIEDDGKTTVTFGDGIKGARLPSGNENVTATYRSGIGLDGNIAATRLSLLKTRPQGIVEVNNPIPATGAAPPESLEEAREKAPPTVRTLDRIVSLRDFEDFARGFAGIGKAQAVALWHEESHLVHITIAAVGGESVLPESSLYTNLIAAIDQARDPLQQVQVDSYDRILFNLEARLLINPRYQPEEVENKVFAALKTTFAFPQRQFGQNVTAAEAIATMQNVEGVIAVDLDALYPSGRSKGLVQSLTAFQAQSDPQTNQVYPAQLLLLNPAGIQLAIVPTL
jgi:predicted phage baseplate assembly protein